MITAPLPVTVRDATAEDMAAIQAIYSFYVTKSCASFEEIPPSVEDMQARRARTLERGLPYLVA